MSSPDLLQQLRRLDKLSSEFPKHLMSILHQEGYKDCVVGLQTDDTAWLVEYLDGVSRRLTSRNLSLKLA